MSKKYLIILIMFPFLFTSCKKEGGGSKPYIYDRVLLAYMGGDNNLSYQSQIKIEQIAKGWNGGNSRIVIYQDPSGTNPRLAEVRKNGKANYVETLEEYSEQNSASPETLSKIISKVRSDYPAKSYGLLVFSHASGWLPEGTLEDPLRKSSPQENPGISPLSIIIDWENGKGNNKEMELSDFSKAIPDKFFDFIVFETCLTANVEVMYELRNKAEYILASASYINDPGFTEIYPTAVSYLMDTKRDIGENLSLFSQSFYRTASASYDYYYSATVTVCKTANLEGLAESVKLINSNRTGDFDINSLQQFDKSGHTNKYEDVILARFFDLEQYVEKIADKNSYRAFREELAKCIVYEAATPDMFMGSSILGGFPITRHCGLTTYVEREEYEFLNTEYRKTSWHQATH